MRRVEDGEGGKEGTIDLVLVGRSVGRTLCGGWYQRLSHIEMIILPERERERERETDEQNPDLKRSRFLTQ